MILLVLRILLSWIRGAVYGKPWELLVRVTDPYLSLFSRIRFLRQGMFDFTPIAAILTLVVALNVIQSIQRFGTITVGRFLGIVTGAVWSGLAFLLVLVLILAIVRAVVLAVRPGQETQITSAVGMMVEPVVSLVRRIVSARSPLTDRQYLYLTIAFLFIVRILGGYLIGLLVRFFYTLPI
ncbi:MAG: YggT family protein [Spirochaetales bacterium]|jgi:YggT family protein|nr:YggT family protein [Spirochaetales bacterium]